MKSRDYSYRVFHSDEEFLAALDAASKRTFSYQIILLHLKWQEFLSALLAPLVKVLSR